MSHATVLSESKLEGITMPYNTPDFGDEPNLWLDFTSREGKVNPGGRNYNKDVYDQTFWQSKQINAVVAPWIPFFTNCNGYDNHLIVYDLFEYDPGCDLPEYDDISIVKPLPLDGLSPNADYCNLELNCRYDEVVDSVLTTTTRWFALKEER